ncbi:MAG: phosphoglucosamine mutase [Hadesarchaea archaeon DG-33-1]|nr:MAG: phosphoglucosamine mutase [Hadesarchaea archaeon DG-33-1]
MGKLFGTSGIRGVVNKDLRPELALDLGLALATYLGNSGTVVVGKDPRTSSDMFESCLVSGLLSGGCDVKKLGIVPTPAVSFAARSLGANAGVMITASHNPPEYNGIKFWSSDGMAYRPEQEAKVEAIYFAKRLKSVPWDKIGKVEAADILPEYINEIANAVSLKRSYKVVLDCGNGAGAQVTPYLLRKLGCKVITLNSQLDGFFPGRKLEPTAENLQELCTVVKSLGADLGLAHDGDADRVAAVDEKGRVAEPDKLLALISANQVRKKGDIVVTTVDASGTVDECVGAKGKVIRTKVGDVSVAAEIKKRGAIFGGEPCGAWIFPEVHLVPDGPLAAAKILELLESAGKQLSELLDELPEHPTVRKKIACPNEKKATVMKKFETRLRRKFKGISDVLTIDGIRFSFKDGSWALVRPSGTEPYIRVTAGGKKEKNVEKIAENAAKILKSLLG